MNLAEPFCVYITKHEPTGRFYIGKGKTPLVVNGEYVGSGKLLKQHVEDDCVKIGWTNFECGHFEISETLAANARRTGWSTEILETFDCSNFAYKVETQLINDHYGKTEGCLNLKTKVKK